MGLIILCSVLPIVYAVQRQSVLRNPSEYPFLRQFMDNPGERLSKYVNARATFIFVESVNEDSLCNSINNIVINFSSVSVIIAMYVFPLAYLGTSLVLSVSLYVSVMKVSVSTVSN
jgi:hypothetical protein